MTCEGHRRHVKGTHDVWRAHMTYGWHQRHVKGTDDMWRAQTMYGGHRQCMEGTDDVWGAQTTCEGHRWRETMYGGYRRHMEATDDVWRPQTMCEGHRQCVEATDNVWRPQMRYGGHRWGMEGTDDIWRVQTTCRGHRRRRRCVSGIDNVRRCVNSIDNVWMAQTTCRGHRQRMEGTDDVGMEQGWVMSIVANLWRTVSKTKKKMSDNLLLGPKRRSLLLGPLLVFVRSDEVVSWVLLVQKERWQGVVDVGVVGSCHVNNGTSWPHVTWSVHCHRVYKGLPPSLTCPYFLCI